MFLNSILRTQRRPLRWAVVFAATAFALWMFLRIVLWLSLGKESASWYEIGTSFLIGIWFDIWTLAYLISPLLLLSALLPRRLRNSQLLKWVGLWAAIALLIFGVIAEIVFWQEFTTRFNFIAVDYLIYTHEVVGNIRESYPVPLVLVGIAFVATCICIALKCFIRFKHLDVGWTPRLRLVVAALALPLIAYLVADIDEAERTDNVYANEISSNGLFSLAAAMRRNELDYDRFYKTIPQQEADNILSDLGVRQEVETKPWYSVGYPVNPSAKLQPTLGPFSRRPRNVVMISVESLSASYVGAYGSVDGLTPNLDSLAAQGLQFDRVLATGTLTVRGLDALSLGTPPIPGQAILRRPKNAHLSTIGELLRMQGYSTFFIYGGYGYFDNMNAYFKNNDYQVFDRMDFDAKTIAAENIWGVADESLFGNSLGILDRADASGKPFFAHIMTTSNHRPYTFPEGRIDLPQGSREGAIKYTDYAIGAFIEQAKAKPWFKDTLFVVVADHCASVAGKTKLPVAKYHIPMVFYAPDMLDQGHYTPLVSQIDLVPTLVHLVADKGDRHYGEADQHFFGQPLLTGGPISQRAFISNYQQLGYYKDDKLIVLSPKKKVEAFNIDRSTLEATPTALPEGLVKEAIAWYQTSALEFKTGKLQEHHPDAN